MPEETRMLDRIFPAMLDNTFRGHRVALGMLAVLVLLKLVMSTNSLLNTRSVAVGADGIALGELPVQGAQVVLMLFALVALGQLALTLLSAVALARYRAMIPLMYLVLLAEHLARRLHQPRLVDRAVARFRAVRDRKRLPHVVSMQVFEARRAPLGRTCASRLTPR
jgi:hypothetical protein